MSLGTYSTICFDGSGQRLDDCELLSNDRDRSEGPHLLDGEYAVEVVKPEVALIDHGGIVGHLERGVLRWHCFVIYAETTADGSAYVLAVRDNNDKKVMLACTTGGDIRALHVQELVGQFLFRAARAMPDTVTIGSVTEIMKKSRADIARLTSG